ncbi:PIR protein, partial [Plasmodium vivax]
FTPVGRLCNKKKKKVKNAYNYEVENIEDLFDYNKNFVNIDPSRNRIRLSYYPS